MGQAVGSQQYVVMAGAHDPVNPGEGVGTDIGDIARSRALRDAGAKVDGDAIQRMGIGNLRAAVAGGIRSLRAAASRDGVVAAAALKGVVDVGLNLDVLSVVRAGLIEARRDIDIGEIRAAHRFDRAQYIAADGCIPCDAARGHIDGNAAGRVAVVSSVAPGAAINVVVALEPLDDVVAGKAKNRIRLARSQQRIRTRGAVDNSGRIDCYDLGLRW